MSKTREVYEAWREGTEWSSPWDASMERAAGWEAMSLPLVVRFSHGEGEAGVDMVAMWSELRTTHPSHVEPEEWLRRVRLVVEGLLIDYERAYRESQGGGAA